MALLVAGLLCLGPATAQEAVEVPNAGFEQLDPQTACPMGWTPWTTPNFAVYTLAAAHSGVACVAITDDDPKVSYGLRSPRIAIDPGATYEALGWLQIERAEVGGFAIYLEYWLGPNRLANASAYSATATDWTRLAVRLRAPEGATEATVLVYGSSATIGRAYFDDISLQRVD